MSTDIEIPLVSKAAVRYDLGTQDHLQGGRMKHFFRVFGSLFTIIFLLSGSPHAAVSFKEAPFQEGERLVYKAKWGRVAAGEAVLETLPSQIIQGQRSHHFVMTARSDPRIDSMYTLRERQDSYTDLELGQTLLYSKRSTGSRPRDVVVTFDWRNLTATSVKSGGPQETVSILPGTLDPLAVIFSIRMRRLQVGDVLEIPLTDGKKCVEFRASVTGMEKLTIGEQSYMTHVVEPDMKSLSGLMKKGRQVKLWYTADEQQIPVKMQSQLPIGSFVFELVGKSS